MRCHRSSKPKDFKGKTVAQTIVRFNTWEARRMCYSVNKTCKNKALSFRVYPDLTQRRFKLLSDARERIDREMRAIHGNELGNLHEDDRVFAYADVNSGLRIRAGKEVFQFNDENRFNDLFTRIFTGWLASRSHVNLSRVDNWTEWLADPNNLYVGRDHAFFASTGYGNPFRVNIYGRAKAIDLFRVFSVPKLLPADIRRIRNARTLGCWCDAECHADVLLKL